MVTYIQLDGDSVALTRFALSPLAETMATLTEAYKHPRRQPGWEWLRSDPIANGLLSLLTQTKYIPDFVALPPDGIETSIDDELTRMAAIGDEHAVATVNDARAASWDTHDPAWAGTPNLTTRVAEGFGRAWSQIEPDWPRRRAILERDVRFRAGLIATGGWLQALTGISPKVRWMDDNRIQFSHQHHDGPVVHEEGLRLVPHTVGTGRWLCEAPPRFAMVYPARGALAPVAPPSGLDSLLGSTKVQILHLAMQPTTPNEFALLLDKSLGTISGHLAALYAAGTLEKTRTGRTVNYSLTAQGLKLLQAFD